MFIYKITNLKNGKVYVGQTINSKPSSRFSRHKNDLKKNKHINKHLQASWNKYGETSFSFEIIERISSEANFDLHSLERYWIKFYNSKNPGHGYNKTDGGEGTRGFIPSELSKKRMSEAQQRRKLSPDYKPNMLGKNHTDEAKKKISIASSCENSRRYGSSNPKLSEFNKINKSKKIICINQFTLERLVFDSLKSAADYFSITSQSIFYRMKTRVVRKIKNKVFLSWTFEYLSEVA